MPQRITPTKIVYLLRTLQLGGIGRDIFEITTNLDRTRFEPKIYCISGGGPLVERAKAHGIDVTVFNALRKNSDEKQIPFWRSRKFIALCRYLKKEQPAIVHCYMYSPAIYGGFATKVTGSKAILLSHRIGLGYFKDGKPHYQVLENVINRFTDGVLVNALAVEEDVLQRERITPEKIHLIYGGVDIQKYSPVHPRDCSQKKRELGIPEEAPVIGMVANLFTHKGYNEFLYAASQVIQKYPAARFLCIGEDRGILLELKLLMENLGLQNHLVFTGSITNMPEFLPILDIQVSASHEEGFSNAILEGMASGKPIVATAVGGTPEMVVQNTTGLLVPPKNSQALAEAIMTLLASPGLAAAFGKNGRTRVETHFSMKKTIQSLETFYLDVLKNRHDLS